MFAGAAWVTVSAFDIKVDVRYLVGDANDDGKIDMTDSLDIKKSCAGINGLIPTERISTAME